MAIQLLGFPTTLGLPSTATRHAPEALRAAGLIRQLEQAGAAVQDLGDMELEPGRKSDPIPLQVRKTVEAARRQAEFWLGAHTPGSLMMTIGGDHSTSLGTLWALSRTHQSFDVVWIDAHGDFNIIETSPSGNPHGMVLALACGLMPEYMPRVIPPAHLHLWGVRDLDPGEKDLLRREKVEVLTPDQVRYEWERIVSRLRPDVFLSFDIDSVEPAEAPGTRTPVPGGFRRHEALEMVAYIARHRNLLAVDIVEYHPDRDRDGLTAELALAVARTAVSGQVQRRNKPGMSAAAGS